MRRVLIGLVALVFIAAALTGCGTTRTKIIYEEVEVPVSYWDPPKNIKPLPEPLDRQVPHLSPEEAKANPTEALQVVGQDMNACLADDELLRHLYTKLVKLCSAPESVPPP
jgi:hypothetical protein